MLPETAPGSSGRFEVRFPGTFRAASGRFEVRSGTFGHFRASPGSLAGRVGLLGLVGVRRSAVP
eukprot:9738111-Alexandrium_andersonii.AAC.1